MFQNNFSISKLISRTPNQRTPALVSLFNLGDDEIAAFEFRRRMTIDKLGTILSGNDRLAVFKVKINISTHERRKAETSLGEEILRNLTNDETATLLNFFHFEPFFSVPKKESGRCRTSEMLGHMLSISKNLCSR